MYTCFFTPTPYHLAVALQSVAAVLKRFRRHVFDQMKHKFTVAAQTRQAGRHRCQASSSSFFVATAIAIATAAAATAANAANAIAAAAGAGAAGAIRIAATSEFILQKRQHRHKRHIHPRERSDVAARCQFHEAAVGPNLIWKGTQELGCRNLC